MASTHKHIRSSTANKRPTTAIADGQIALNTNTTSPGLFFKDSTGATIIKVGPVHVGTTAPNVSPPAGGSSGNSTGEVWLDTSLTPNGVKIWNGSSWTNATPIGSTTVQGLLELATSAETQTGTDPDRAVTPAGLQSKVSDSTSTTSSTTIASSTAVKAAYDLANAALPKSGGTITGNLEIGTTGSLTFEGATADAFETIIAVTDPTADRTITLPDTTGTIVTTGDTGTVTSTMIADGTIVNADVNASAAIAGTKISPDFGSQNVVTTGTSTAASFIPTSSTVPTNGVYLPAANSVALATNSTGRLFIDSSGNVGVSTSSPTAALDVTGTAIASAALLTGNKLSTGTSGTLRFTSSGGINYIQSALNNSSGSAGPLVFGSHSASAEWMRLTSDGKVGIGTTSPGNKLSIRDGDIALVSGVNAADAGQSIRFFANAVDDTSNNFAEIKGGLISTGTPQLGYLRFSTSGTERLRITSAGNVGIGTTSPGALLHAAGIIRAGAADTSDAIVQIGASLSGNRNSYLDLVGDTTYSTYGLRIIRNNGGANTTSQLLHRGTGNFNLIAQEAAPIAFYTANAERARIDSSGRLLVGTSTSVSTLSGIGSVLQVNEGSGVAASILRSTNDNAGANIVFRKTRGTSPTDVTVVQSGDSLGRIVWMGTDGANPIEAARIETFVDNTPGVNDMPSRLVFSTTADGASSPTERMRITQGGYLKASNDGNYSSATGAYHELYQTANAATLWARSTNVSLADTVHYVTAARSNNSAYHFLVATSGYGGVADDEFRLRGDGNAFADGTWTGGGADYAEYFEWSDDNPDAEDRRGISVVLDGDKIREAQAGEDPIGVISGNPSVVGDAAWNKWSGKYLRDEYGTYIQEDYEVTDDDGNTVIQQRRKLNPAYDPDVEYISREQRPEWDCVGLMGKLRIRKGQVTGSRWIKMRDISATVEEWLVR